MTRLFASALVFALLVPASAAAQCDCPAEEALIVGHRGDGSGTGENTVASVEAAFAAGADMAEIDVQQSADGVVVLMHDDTVDRTTAGTGCVSALNAAELDGLGVPTLTALLGAVDGALDVEIKLHDTDACPAQDLLALADAVAADLEADPVTNRRVLVTSFDRPLLQRVHAVAPSVPIGLLGGSPELIDAAAADGFSAVALFGAVINSRTVRRADEADIELVAWTINGSAELESVLVLGIDGVITDTVVEGIEARTAVCESWSCSPDAGSSGDAGADAGPDGTPTGGCAVHPHGSSPRTPTPWPVMLSLLAVSRWMRRPHKA